MKKENVIWFSRHQPTTAQTAEAARRGWEIVCVEEGANLGAITLQDDGDVHAVGTALMALVEEHQAIGIIGVWTAPMMEMLARTANDAVHAGQWCGITCYAAWNISRPPVDGKPQFEHRRFCRVGELSQSALRWGRGQ